LLTERWQADYDWEKAPVFYDREKVSFRSDARREAQKYSFYG